ncbi:uncharacterized protein LOC135213895 [Macrobrachium nipponense]|uniref:uncharacterized protein LOC135213895 n=1 Tax=Macrobrachium nipponense TaxID=159736 RepID=UPI0030C893E3
MEGNMSDFGSEDEDAEFALYAQLYFEPNDITVDDIPKRTLCELSKCPQIGVTEKQKKDFCKDDDERTYDQVGEDLDKIPNNGSHLESVTDTLKRKLNTECNGSKCHQVSDVQHKSQNGLETKSKDLKFEGKPVASDQFNTSQQLMISKSDGLVGLSNLPLRRRNSSICSVDSISGKVPLDNLYCNVFDSLAEKDELEGELSPSKIVKGLKKKKVITGKRKKSSSLSDSSDEEDSRCRILKALNNKKGKFGKGGKGLEKMSTKKKGLDKRSVKKRKALEVVTIDSDTSENCRNLPACQEASQVVNGHDEIQVIGSQDKNAVFPGIQELDKEKRYSQPARVVVISTAEDHLHNSISVSKADHSVNSELVLESSSSSSSSDSDCVMYMKESPNLVMNFVKESNPKLKQKVTGKERNPKLKQKITGKGCNPKLKQKVTDQSRQLRTFDYTKRRPATKKTPSCTKFTPEMASFYDSDESDFFDIEEIHDQQSGLSSDWKIISSDLYVTPKKRYYNQESKCTLCRQWGHTISECSRVQYCHICSGTDHVRREQCPSNCCFRCGGRFHGFLALFLPISPNVVMCIYVGTKERWPH